ncbi:hypothetical protein PVK06_048988 [Gossypium arboreum]|uniref:RNase H type-1 domain-containing protein n=1 Tax=Gossypium arboreum TaxID=29729 RepID=A0ABR0MHD8_GOSAR|nr:hypothetical protein PVK06_048988 [Gossypium arboreum]
MNTNGVRKPHIGLVCLAGIAKDIHNRWIFGYDHNIRKCSVEQAELWVIYDGLKLLWSKGWKLVVSRCDCLIVVEAINGNYKGVVNRVLICKIKEHCTQALVVHIKHFYKESNGVANTLAGVVEGGSKKGKDIFQGSAQLLFCFVVDGQEETWTKSASSQNSQGTKRKWVPKEDVSLVACIVNLYNAGTCNTYMGFKSHKVAGQFRHHSFSYDEQLTSIYAKDRATEKDAQTTAYIIEEIDVEDVATANNLEEGNNYHECENDVSLDEIDVSATQSQPSKPNQDDSTFSKKKKKNLMEVNKFLL